MKMIKTISFFSYISLLIIISTSPAHSAYHTESTVYNPVRLMKTVLKFYLHDTISGTNPSAVKIAGPNATEDDPVPFGSLLAMDDPMTEGPEVTSEVIGNARGMYVSTKRGGGLDVVFVMYADYGFTAGRFNGSSFSVLSRNAIMDDSRELAVVGGRGRFKAATGTATVTTVSLDVVSGDAILEYNVEIVHAGDDNGGLGFVETVV